MAIGTTIALGAMKMIGGAGLSTIINDRNNKQAEQMSARDRATNYKYNEMAAEEAYKRQLQYTEMYMTPEAQIEHLRNAGLSPSLMYGAGGSTQGTSAPMGSGTSGVRTNYNSLNVQDMMTLAQMGLVQAQTEKVRTETAAEKGETAKSAAEIAEILSRKGMNEASTNLMESEKAINDIIAYVKDKTKDTEISIIESKALQAEQDVYKALYEAQKAGLEVQITTETFDEIIKQAELNTQKLATEIQKNYAEINLTNTEIYQIVENVKLAYRDIVVKENLFKLEKGKYDFEKFKFQKTMEFELEKYNKNLHFSAHKEKVNGIVNIIGRSFSYFVGASVLKMGTNGMSVQAPSYQSNFTY